MIDFPIVAASAGVMWDDSAKFTFGHIARVLMVDGDGFYHPCTCVIGVDHDALVPSDNLESSEEPQYTPLPDRWVQGTDPIEDSQLDPTVMPSSDSPERPEPTDLPAGTTTENGPI